MRIRRASWDDAADREILIHIREVVYIDEQQVNAREEFEGLDPQCPHFIAEIDGQGDAPSLPVGVARLRSLEDGTLKAERFAVLVEHRGRGIGRALVQAVEDEARRRGGSEIVLAAQVRAITFYERLGYEVYGEEFKEAGITHRMMRKRLG
jgi:predicted GNAT family N-acyltransferase